LDRVEEKRLLRLAQQGDADAFAELYRANVQAIYRYIYHRVHDTHLAEDLTGDVFTKALEGLARYQEKGRPFIAWLYRIAHARVIDHYRRVDRRPSESDVEAEPIAVTPNMDSGLVQQQVGEMLKTVIDDLTDEQQQVIILRFIEGYRIDKVAQMMGKSPNAIKALQHRALRSLANRLDRSGFDIESVLAGLS
jgi:RNA polymerase sigma-70 factor (ECF subfamily)